MCLLKFVCTIFFVNRCGYAKTTNCSDGIVQGGEGPAGGVQAIPPALQVWTVGVCGTAAGGALGAALPHHGGPGPCRRDTAKFHKPPDNGICLIVKSFFCQKTSLICTTFL